MRFFTRLVAPLLCVSMAAFVPLHAQVLSGSIVGQVADASGAVVPEASVKITHRETNQGRSSTTGANGEFSFPSLPGGTYDVVVSKAGFQTFTAQAVAVTVGQVARVDAVLRVG